MRPGLVTATLAEDFKKKEVPLNYFGKATQLK